MSGPFTRLGPPSADDDERLTRLYRETREDLLAFIARRCATAEDAADCLADTYRVAWEKRTRLPADPQARPWLFGIARNAVREERRRGERRAATSHALIAAAERGYIDTTPERTALTAAMSALPALDREIVLMLSADGLASHEVATILGLSATAVRSRAVRARTKLRQRLASGDADDDPGHADAAPASGAPRSGARPQASAPSPAVAQDLPLAPAAGE
jgi:RNA polymerase sigma-70 factor, ECF subfamily